MLDGKDDGRNRLVHRATATPLKGRPPQVKKRRIVRGKENKHEKEESKKDGRKSGRMFLLA